MKISLKDDNQGIALVTVIMTMLVLTLLSVSSLTVTTSNLKNGIEERKFQSAYYIAEAGANYGFEYYKSKLLSNNNDIDSLELSVASGHFSEQYGDSPTASVKLIGPEIGAAPQEKIYTVMSIGTIDSISRTVTKSFIIKRTSGGGSGFKSDYAILTKGSMDFEGGEVNGPIFSNGDINLSLTEGETIINGNVYSRGNLVFDNSAKIYGDAYAKGFLKLNNWGDFISNNAYILKDIYINTGNTLEGHIRGNAYIPASGTEEGFIKMNEVELPSEDSFPKFPDFPNESECVIKTKSDIVDGVLDIRGPNKATYIPQPTVKFPTNDPYIAELKIKYDDGDILMLNSLDIGWSTINLEGNGRLNIYIKGSIKLNGLALNIPKGQNRENYTVEKAKENANNLAIYVKGDSNRGNNKQIKVEGSDVIIGSIFAEDANFTVSGSGKFHGNLVTGGQEVLIEGGAKATTQIIYAPNAHVILKGSGHLKGPIVSNTFKSDGDGNVSYDPESDSEEIIDDPFFPDTEDIIEIIPGPVTEK